MTQELPVPASKVSPPGLADAITRESVATQLAETAATPITWLAAPSGSGKTTAVAQFLSTNKIKTVWLRLDATDADPATLFYFLGHAAKQANPRKRGSLPLFTLEYTGGLAAFSQSYIGALCGYLKAPGAIVLDDYQNLPPDSPFHQVLADWAGWLPEGMRIIVTSQAEPPPLFAKVRGRRQLATIGWDNLQFSPEETRQLVHSSLGEDIDPALVEKLNNRCGGWAAGILLSLEGAQSAGPSEELTSALDINTDPELVFEFFAAEIYSRFTEDERNSLIRIALLPQCTGEMAAAICDDDGAAALLQRMVKQGWFVSRHSGAGRQTVFRLHGLFRAFLLERLSGAVDSDRLGDLRKQAAKLLDKDGQADIAIELLLEYGDIQSAIPMLLGNAMQLVGQGRFSQLSGWLARIPLPMQDGMPWLRFWRGVAELPLDPLGAYEHLAASHATFKVMGDPLGPWMAWVATVRAIKFSKQGFDRLDPWIELIDEFNHEQLAMLPPDLQAQVATTVLDTLYMHQPDHPELKTWAERAEAQWQQIEDADQFYLAAQILVNYLVFNGNAERARLVLDALSQRPSASPFARMVTIWAEGFYDWMTDRHAHCLEICDEALDLGARQGIHLLDQNLLSHKVHALLPDGRIEEAAACINQMRERLTDTEGFDAAHYHYLQACLGLHQEDADLALEHATTALKLSASLHSPLFQGMVAHAACCATLTSDPTLAREHLQTAQGHAQQADCPILSWQCQLSEAELAIVSRDGPGESAHDALTIAMQTGATNGFYSHLFWLPRNMTRLAEAALRADIEIGYVQNLIRKRRLEPADPALAPPGWPWPVRISGFGGFDLCIDGESEREQGGRVMALLKALYWLGGRQVPESRLAAVLWPDSEGDAAHHALENLLYRVRKYLSDRGDRGDLRDVVLLQDGQIGFNPALCWLDLWAFRDLLTRLDQQITEHAPAAEVEHSAYALLRLHHAPLLPEEDAGDIIAQRKTLQDRLVRQTLRAGQYLDETESARSLPLYQSAVEAAPLAEDLYERLIRAYQSTGRTADATEAYRQCRQRLLDELGVEPGAAVKAAISG